MSEAINASGVELERVRDDWEDLVSAGVAIVEAHDRNRWALGALGDRVTQIAAYGDAMLKDYASAVRVRGSTMYEYVKVRRFYPLGREEDFPALSWSHYQQAARCGDLDKALALLTQANDENMSVDSLRKTVNESLDKPVPPAKLVDEIKQARMVKFVDESTGEIREAPAILLPECEADKPYRIAVWEAIE